MRRLSFVGSYSVASIYPGKFRCDFWHYLIFRQTFHGGKPAVKMKEGDVINIPVGVKHWHGAGKYKWFSHLAIEVPSENGKTEWLESVSDEDYENVVALK